MRIHITGNAGAGKTTLARRLSEHLGLPCYHLDQIVWQPHWKKSTAIQRARAIDEITSGASWVIEGVAKAVREKSDLIVFLDVPRHRCLWRCGKRNIRYLFRSRPELPEHCPEILILPSLLKIIWNFPNRAGLEIRREAEQLDKYLVLRDAQSLPTILDTFHAARADRSDVRHHASCV